MIFSKRQRLLNFSPIFKYKIEGFSMSPALKPGQYVLVSKLSYLFSKPKFKDLVAIKDPRDGKTLIKRISQIKNDKYYVLGDNPNASTDSRKFGWIGKKDIIGKVIYKLKVQS